MRTPLTVGPSMSLGTDTDLGCGHCRLHDNMRTTARSSQGKTHVSHDDASINTNAVNFALAFNNLYACLSYCPAACVRISPASHTDCGNSHTVPRLRVYSLYLFCMVFFGFYFLRSQSLEVNYPLSLILTMTVIFFANQEI